MIYRDQVIQLSKDIQMAADLMEKEIDNIDNWLKTTGRAEQIAVLQDQKNDVKSALDRLYDFMSILNKLLK